MGFGEKGFELGGEVCRFLNFFRGGFGLLISRGWVGFNIL